MPGIQWKPRLNQPMLAILCARLVIYAVPLHRYISTTRNNMTAFAQKGALFPLDPTWSIRQKVLFSAWVGFFVCYIYAFRYSPYPNQVYWLYVLSGFAISYQTFKNSRIAYAVGVKAFSIFALYIAALYFVSFGELFHGVSAVTLPTY